MIWSERRNFCFIHVPKTGGSAITAAYSKEMCFGDVLLGGPAFAEKLQQIYHPQFGVHKHSLARNIQSIVGMDRFGASYSFALIRDPMARLVSYYRWLQKEVVYAQLSENQKKLKSLSNFGEFVEEASKTFVPQADYVEDKFGKPIVSELFLYERLVQDWPKISGRMGISVDLPVANRSPSFPVSVDAAAKAIVQSRYVRDLDLLERIYACA